MSQPKIHPVRILDSKYVAPLEESLDPTTGEHRWDCDYIVKQVAWFKHMSSCFQHQLDQGQLHQGEADKHKDSTLREVAWRIASHAELFPTEQLEEIFNRQSFTPGELEQVNRWLRDEFGATLEV